MTIVAYIQKLAKEGRSAEEIHADLKERGYRASMTALKKYVKKNPSKIYENCRMYVQRITGISDIESLPTVTKPKIGDILWWGSDYGYSHMAIYAGKNYVLHVSEWGSQPEKIKINKLNDIYGDLIFRIYRPLKKNPVCKKAGMSKKERQKYNKEHGTRIQKGVTNISNMERLKRWGAWATRFYGRKDRPPLVQGNRFTPLACSALAWGRNPPANWREAQKIYRDGKEALDLYKELKESVGERYTFTIKERKLLNKKFLEFYE